LWSKGRRYEMSGQARYWMLTIPHEDFTPYLPNSIAYIRGQSEIGNSTEYQHWQVYVHFKRTTRLAGVKKIFGTRVHAEPTRSEAAEQYVWKEDTRVEGTQFELGKKPIKRNCEQDWDQIRRAAEKDDMESIPSDIYIRCYSNLKRIAAEHSRPQSIVKTIYVFWGKTGTGKSRRAWEEASLEAYPKAPTTKFWDGYRGQKNVVMDEFRGQIEISHLLRWLDRYPVLVEVKGSSTVLKAEKIWITSNLSPKDWYPNLDEETRNALLRRLTIIHFDSL